MNKIITINEDNLFSSYSRINSKEKELKEEKENFREKMIFYNQTRGN